MAFGAQKGAALTGTSNSISTSIAASGSVAVAIGDLIVCVVGEQTGPVSVTSVTDNLHTPTTYTAQNAGTDAGSSTGRMFYFVVTTAGTLTTVTATCNGGTHDGAIVAAVFTGFFATPPIDANPANGASDIVTPYTCPASGTLTMTGELVVAWAAMSSGQSNWAGSSPFTINGNPAGANIGVAIASAPVFSTASVTPSFTGTAPSSDDVLGTASFKPLVDARMGMGCM